MVASLRDTVPCCIKFELILALFQESAETPFYVSKKYKTISRKTEGNQRSREPMDMKWWKNFLLILPLVVGITCEIDIKSGALIQNHGKGELLTDFAVVKINVNSILEREEHLNQLDKELRKCILTHSDSAFVEVLRNLQGKIEDIVRPQRNKRSLLPFVGSAFSALFGVATENDVRGLTDRVELIEKWANQKGNLISTLIENNNKNVENIKKMVEFINQVNVNVSNKIDDVEQVFKLIHEVEIEIGDHKESVNGLINAQKGILSPAIISPKTLKEIIDWCIVNSHSKPLLEDIFWYYTMSTVKVTKGYLLVLIPFKGMNLFDLYTIHPFPVKIGNATIIWNHPKVRLALDKNKLLMIILEEGDLEQCVLISESQSMCNFVQIKQPMSNFPCIQGIFFENYELMRECKFETFALPYRALHLGNEIFVYVQSTKNAEVTCDGKTQTFQLGNLKSFADSCSVVINDYLYYVPSVFLHYELNQSSIAKSYENKINHFQLDKLTVVENVAMPLDNDYVLFYKQDVAPFLTMCNVFLIVLITVVTYNVVKYLVFRKLERINELLLVITGKPKE
ncbi:uncharacterized protein [Palaemon carinicauda]|uniref:uncharacterized protein isoform X1 n=2 Tax=Palaemon carinicauda TaxID=392227 RepID=UPI0035B67BE3